MVKMVSMTNDEYLSELEVIKNKLNKDISFIENGEPDYFKDAALRLRILYFSKSGQPPFLKRVFDKFKVNVQVRVPSENSIFDAIEEIKELEIKEKIMSMFNDPQSTLFSVSNNVISWLETNDEQKIDLLEAINQKEVQINNEKVKLPPAKPEAY